MALKGWLLREREIKTLFIRDQTTKWMSFLGRV